jgi:signal transduction histidine kinase
MILFQTAPNPAFPPPAYLGYSLLIILVCVSALAKVIRKWQVGRYPQGFRMVQGLIILSVLHLTSFLVTYFSWQLEPVFSPSLLVMDQAASLIGIIVIFWLWNFPEPSREVDPGAIALMVITTVLAIVQIIFLPDLLEGLTGTTTFWQGISITALVIGSGLIIIRKPNLWVYGLLMGIMLFLGSLITLISDDLNLLHIAQLAAYPLLLILADRFPIGESLIDEFSEEDDEKSRRRVSVDYDKLVLIQKLFDEKDPAGILYKIAQTTAYLILSDLALIIDTPDEHGKIRIIAGYDLIREEPLQALTLDSRSIPLLSNYIQRGKLLHIPASSTSRDLSHLSKMLQLSKPGHLLAAPVHVSGANKTIGVVLFSPFSNRPWTKADQDYILLLTKLYEAAFSHHLVSQDGESDSVKSTIRDLTSQLTLITRDKQNLKDEMAVLSKNHQNLLLDQDVLQTKYEELRGWGNSLERHLAMLVDLSEKESTEALRKYIGVIEKEVQQAREDQADIKIDLEITTDPEPEELDPDSVKPANLGEAIQNCLENAQPEIEEKAITTSLALPDDPPLLKMNHALFQEIFSFLVANAIEENNQGGEIIIKTQIYEEDRSQHFAHIKITDQGDGYYPDEISVVLNDHLTTDQQEKLNQVMTNLYVTKNLVENEGGRMWVESKPGEGTTVSLLLAFL